MLLSADPACSPESPEGQSSSALPDTGAGPARQGEPSHPGPPAVRLHRQDDELCFAGTAWRALAFIVFLFFRNRIGKIA